MPIKGVTEEQESIIKSILNRFNDKYEFFYYGSRVKGNFRQLSDLDIFIKSDDKIDLDDIDDLKTAFDESKLPYIVNFAYDVDSNFYNLIKQDFIKII